ncbi:transcription antitermination factor NusB [candidate division TA06 bacterium]|jgi:N utilization substance protein B|uniref:Transcription antitermination protein NusB n=1 Tax=candidate division TA06 bacterium TaxID=2250710 RepID=A0A660S8H9_UNCT6|nr:MAG: transcription antitermination factor NusB [candidate division TA06 bacterium]
MGSRRKARELALEALYRLDLMKDSIDSILADIKSRDYSSEVYAFMQKIVKKTVENLDYIDGIIKGVAINWRLERMTYIDKNIIRLGIAELLYFPDIPPKVTMNEYIEIAKKYSTDDAGKFVNGILDKIAKGEYNTEQ